MFLLPVRQLRIGLLPEFIVGLLQQGPGRLLRVVQQFISLNACPGQQGIGLAAVAQGLAGDLLATLDDRSIKASLDQAKAQLQQNQAQLQGALIDLKRYQLLSVDNGVSKQTLDQQQALVNQLKATAAGPFRRAGRSSSRGTKCGGCPGH